MVTPSTMYELSLRPNQSMSTNPKSTIGSHSVATRVDNQIAFLHDKRSSVE